MQPLESDSPYGTETVVPRVGRLVVQPGGYRALVPSPLPPVPSLRHTPALDQRFADAVRAITEFAADHPRRARVMSEETLEDHAVRQAAEFLAEGVPETAWSIDLLCEAHKCVVRVSLLHAAAGDG